jgi:glycosyl transferase family 92
MSTIYRNQARFLPEWIEFHRLVGVERFFLYNNLSDDDHREVLDTYVRDGTVVLHDWPDDFPQGLITAANHCLSEHRDDSRWIAFQDLDEYLFSPTLEPVSSLLPEYERSSSARRDMSRNLTGW